MKRAPIGLLLLTLVGVLPLVGARLNANRDALRMARAAEAFLSALDEDQRERATFDFAVDERTRWHFIPPESFPRAGVMLGEMDAAQRASAESLLRTGLSQRGYVAATTIMELESVLRAIEGGERFARDPDEYRFTVFGTPTAAGTWAWRFEGHHISLHFTIVEGDVIASAPAFFGANPAEVLGGPLMGTRALGMEEDAARSLVLALDASQQAIAIVSDAVPSDIITGAELEIDPLSPVGIRARDLSAKQRELLMALINAYTSVMADDVAAHRMARLRAAGLDDVSFAWAGSVEPKEAHYYRVQGPTFLIEYDNTQNDANHIHSVWRDFDGDFGDDLLRAHVTGTPHS